MYFSDIVTMVVLVCVTMFIKGPMHLLVLIMLFMLIVLFKVFSNNMDYWTLMIMLLSFLVGLFLMFVYLVSFFKKDIISNRSAFFFKGIYLLSIVLLAMFDNSSLTISLFCSDTDTSSPSWYEKWIQEKSGIVIFFVLAFFLLIILVFYMMKKSKKNMKSSK